MKILTGLFSAALASMALFIAPARADVWDSYDDLPANPHDLTQGSDEAHDLATRPGPVADVDWSRVPQEAYSSYEVTVDGIVSPKYEIELARFDATGTTLLQTGVAPNVVGGSSRVLQWLNGSTAVADMVRVRGGACGTSCGKDVVYRIRAVETTIAVPRYHNGNGLTTTLVYHNSRPVPVTVKFYLWSSAGALQAQWTTFMPARGVAAINTLSIVSDSWGSITVAHDAGYGGLAVKAITTDSATGYSFDTIGTYKPR